MIARDYFMLYAHDDPSGWGKQFVMAAGKLGHEAKLFSRASEVPDGARAFVRLDQKRDQRLMSKELVAALSDAGVITLPTRQEAYWYDDKAAQIEALHAWLPDTYFELDKQRALELARSLAFPIISKSIDGSSSKAVRLLNDAIEAAEEIGAVFGAGIPSVYDRVQRGYIYWQRFLPDNPCDYRVCICGGYVFGLVRNNRPDKPFASGSGDNYPLTMANERECEAVALAIEIAGALKTRWMAFDIVFDGDTPQVLEISSSWTPQSYARCPAFPQSGGEVRTGAHMFEMAVEALLDTPQ